MFSLNSVIKRLHSSRMHTTHVLTVSPSMPCTRGMPGPGGMCLLWGVPAPGGGAWSRGACSWGVSKHALRQTPSPVNRMTNRCKNITLPQTSFAGGKNICHHSKRA